MSTNLPNLQPLVDNIRALAMDGVQKAESGHPGLPLGMADAAATLWSTFLAFNPQDPAWPNRDRFVLSAGHGSMLLYSLLHLSGYDLPLEALKNFRQWGSQTPGHPEYGHTPGVETTTGPLGQGISNAVGMAIAERWLAARFNRPDFPVVDHHTFVIASDGDLMEGVSHETCSLAGHLSLGRLIVLYDDNKITIDGSTDLSFTEDVLMRYQAYGWQTLRADGHNRADVAAALEQALADKSRPTIIACRTVIGYGSPNRQGTSKAHGEPLGVDEIKLAKEGMGWPTDELFRVIPEATEILAAAARRGQARQAEWQALLHQYETVYPDLHAEFSRLMRGELPAGWDSFTPDFGDKGLATRAASGKVLEYLIERIPELLGGSADLTPSNNTRVSSMTDVQDGSFAGRYVRFGIREHGMGAVMNGLAVHGGVLPYGGTFLVFSDYMRPTLRLAALMGLPVIHVFTHDSVGLGEDGPTHQPIEHLAALRAIPNYVVFRPADAWETWAGWQAALQRQHAPTALILTRQKLPLLDPAQAAGAINGGYILSDRPEPVAILLATGSEVYIALAAQKLLDEQNIAARVVSLPSWELFRAMSHEYQETVLPPNLKVRVAMEAAATFGWERFVGSEGIIIGLDRFGASAPYETIYQELGLTAEAMAAAVQELLTD
ncbi:MAG: transketolase [Chloroflexi bacterium]|nr:transketolase [Chloroflexota bacterium]